MTRPDPAGGAIPDHDLDDALRIQRDIIRNDAHRRQLAALTWTPRPCPKDYQ